LSVKPNNLAVLSENSQTPVMTTQNVQSGGNSLVQSAATEIPNSTNAQIDEVPLNDSFEEPVHVLLSDASKSNPYMGSDYDNYHNVGEPKTPMPTEGLNKIITKIYDNIIATGATDAKKKKDQENKDQFSKNKYTCNDHNARVFLPFALIDDHSRVRSINSENEAAMNKEFGDVCGNSRQNGHISQILDAQKLIWKAQKLCYLLYFTDPCDSYVMDNESYANSVGHYGKYSGMKIGEIVKEAQSDNDWIKDNNPLRYFAIMVRSNYNLWGQFSPNIGFHRGIDTFFLKGSSTPVYAIASGVVIIKGNGYISIYNKALNKTLTYMHTKPLSSLAKHSLVAAGDQIGTEAGRSMNSTTNDQPIHNHFEVNLGQYCAEYNANGYTRGGEFGRITKEIQLAESANTSNLPLTYTEQNDGSSIPNKVSKVNFLQISPGNAMSQNPYTIIDIVWEERKQKTENSNYTSLYLDKPMSAESELGISPPAVEGS